jgi:hypothetical protein
MNDRTRRACPHVIDPEIQEETRGATLRPYSSDGLTKGNADGESPDVQAGEGPAVVNRDERLSE